MSILSSAVSRMRNDLVVRGHGVRNMSEGHPSGSIRGLIPSFISFSGEREQSTFVYSRDTLTVQTGTLREGGDDDQKIIQKHSEGDCKRML